MIGVDKTCFWPSVVLFLLQMSNWRFNVSVVYRPLGEAHAVIFCVFVVFIIWKERKVLFDKMREQTEDKSRVPLKTILQNFLNHVDSMETQKRERDNPFEQEFQVNRVNTNSTRFQGLFVQPCFNDFSSQATQMQICEQIYFPSAKINLRLLKTLKVWSYRPDMAKVRPFRLFVWPLSTKYRIPHSQFFKENLTLKDKIWHFRRTF